MTVSHLLMLTKVQHAHISTRGELKKRAANAILL
jgi:hypothetical protein